MAFIMDGMRQAGFQLGQDDCTAMLVEQIPRGEIVFTGTTPVCAEHITALAADMERALTARAWPEPSLWAAHLLLIEHGANVLRHGQCSAGGSLTVQVRCLDCALELLITDNGQPWKYEEAPAIEPEAMAQHGRGLMMIRRISSYLASHRNGDRNVNLFGILRNWTVPP
jgi:anti-sigma regulatory factor (Ser/Thr protein kinase)